MGRKNTVPNDQPSDADVAEGVAYFEDEKLNEEEAPDEV